MKKWVGKFLPLFLICAVGIAAIWIGIVYFDFISERIYEDSTEHLGEIYGQVNRSFGAFVERNWGLLDNWGDYFALAGEQKGDAISDFIADKQEYWGFSEFYFLSENKTFMRSDGSQGETDLGGFWETLLQDNEPVMVGETLSTGQVIQTPIWQIP